jgi:serine/threonine protein phosphatase 1
MEASSQRVIAIGDVHGCIHALDAVLEAIAPTASDTIIFLGDLIDNGHDTRQVLERIVELRSRCQVVLIQGNHEEMMLAARESVEAFRFWDSCGGRRLSPRTTFLARCSMSLANIGR